MVDEGLLQRMQRAVVGQALDGGDLGAVLHDGQGQAGIDAPAVDQHRAGAALAVVAALLGAGQVEWSRSASSRVVQGATVRLASSPLTSSVTVIEVGRETFSTARWAIEDD